MRWERTIRHPQPGERFAAELRGATIGRVGRRAKSVLLHLDDGRVMTVALRMTGALIVAPAGTPDDRYARVVFRLADGRELRYRDVRKFGRIGLWERGGVPRRRDAGQQRRVAENARAVPGRRRLRAPRAGAAGRTPSARRAWPARLKGRSARLKTLLLDQTFIAGVGNIYADEALWRARLHPLRAADTLTAGGGAAAASRDPRRAPAGDREPRRPASATTSARTASPATTPSGSRSTSAPASRACAAGARSRGSWSGSAARTSARTASGCPRRRAAE